MNTDFSDAGLSSDEILAVVSAWQSNAISTATMRDIFRRGEVLPPGRSNAEEDALIRADRRMGVGGVREVSPASKVPERIRGRRGGIL